MKRRQCLQALTVGGTLLASGVVQAAHHRRIERVGLQLFTVRDRMARDVPGTLAAVAAIGYREVETAGTGDLSPQAFAAALTDAGLTAPAAHIPINALVEQPEAVLEAAEIIGYAYLVVPWLPPEMRTAEGYGRTIDALNRFGERSARVGIQTAYHNHDFEFTGKIGAAGITPYDLMLQHCDPALVKFELDLFWAAHAGADAAAYLRGDPTRFPMCHVKDRSADGQMTDVGAGTLPFAELFAAGSGLRHYFVEHDRPQDSLASVAASYAAVSTLRF